MKTAKPLNIFPLLIFCCLTPMAAPAQAVLKRTAVTGYNMENGLLQNTINNVVVDKFGFVWFSSTLGVQRFDGSHFETIRLNQDSVAYRAPLLQVTTNGEIWISHAKGIVAINVETNKSRIILNKPPPSPGHLHKWVGEDATSAWYLAYPEAVLQIEKHTGKIQSTLPLPSAMRITRSRLETSVIDNEQTLIWLGYSLAIFNRRLKKITFHYADKQFITGYISLNSHTIVYTKDSLFYKIDTRTRRQTSINNFEKEFKAFSSIKLFVTPDKRLLAGYAKNLYELDTATFKIKTKWSAYNQDHLINSGSIYEMYADNFGRLWLMTNSDGVKRLTLNPQSFRYYGTANREANFIRSIYVDKNKGQVLAGTYGSGLLVFDTAGYQQKQILPGENETVTGIAPLETGQYLLLCMGYDLFSIWDEKKGTVSRVQVDARKKKAMHSSYYGGLLRLNDGSFLFSDEQLFHFRIKNGKLADTATIRPKVSWFYVVCKTTDGFCIASENGIELTDKTFSPKTYIPFSQPIAVRCVAEDAKGNIWLGSESGLYTINATRKSISKYTTAQGPANNVIYAIEAAADGIYFSHNKGLSFIAEGKFQHYTRYSGLQENEFNTLSSFKHSDGEIYFGGINGISAFYHNNLSFKQQQPPVLITNLLVMDKPWKDTAVWNISKLTLPYNQNMLAIRIGIPSAIDPALYYEHKMEGLEDNWIRTTGTDHIRYILPPGRYVFKARIYSTNAATATERQLLIEIKAPWWTQWWFKTLIGLLFIFAVILLIQNYNRKKYIKKIEALELDHRIQLERERLSRDLHDNLGAYASAISNNVDNILKNPSDYSRLSNLKENASEIMTHLRDTIWALNKNQISATRLSDRIKNYLQKMREAYPQFKITMQENIDEKVMFSPEFALNILRIVQEGFNNAARHSQGNQFEVQLQIDKQIHLRMKDNGNGATLMNGDGNGIENMKVRARENQLRMTIDSQPMEGTSIELCSTLQ